MSYPKKKEHFKKSNLVLGNWTTGTFIHLTTYVKAENLHRIYSTYPKLQFCQWHFLFKGSKNVTLKKYFLAFCWGAASFFHWPMKGLNTRTLTFVNKHENGTLLKSKEEKKSPVSLGQCHHIPTGSRNYFYNTMALFCTATTGRVLRSHIRLISLIKVHFLFTFNTRWSRIPISNLFNCIRGLNQELTKMYFLAS